MSQLKSQGSHPSKISAGSRTLNHSQTMTRTHLRASFVVGTMAVVSLVLAGCGPVGSSTASGLNQTVGQITNNQSNNSVSTTNPTNPPFQDRLKDMPATPDPQFQPLPADQATYSNITVYTADGQQIQLDASKTPILFEAYWCPHCQRTLVLLNKNRAALKQFPVLVSMGFAPGTPLAQAVSITQQELNYFHINNVKEYYYLGTDSKNLVPHGYPTMAFLSQSGIDTLAGEHTLKVWEQAVSDSDQ